jgi:hypothetical protein
MKKARSHWAGVGAEEPQHPAEQRVIQRHASKPASPRPLTVLPSQPFMQLTVTPHH